MEAFCRSDWDGGLSVRGGASSVDVEALRVTGEGRWVCWVILLSSWAALRRLLRRGFLDSFVSPMEGWMDIVSWIDCDVGGDVVVNVMY